MVLGCGLIGCKSQRGPLICRFAQMINMTLSERKQICSNVLLPGPLELGGWAAQLLLAFERGHATLCVLPQGVRILGSG